MRGIGSDIIEISRIKNAYEKHGKKFLDRVFTQNEQNYCLSFKAPQERLAVRFAAKEAVAKALGVGFGKDLSFLDIEIINLPSGKPEVILSSHLSFSFTSIHLSLSHCKEYALAVAFIEN
jgi:holo-[acyl-carrier protein] synthase